MAEEPVRQVVGIVGDTRTTGLANDPGPMMYVPQAQLPDALNERLLSLTGMTWVVRTSGGSGTLSATIQQEIRQAMDVAVTDVRSMEEIVSLGTSRRGFGALGITAGLIAAFYLVNPLAAGLYGVDRHDPLVFAAVPIVLALVSFAAVVIPSQRAVAMRPMDALRHE